MVRHQYNIDEMKLNGTNNYKEGTTVYDIQESKIFSNLQDYLNYRSFKNNFLFDGFHPTWEIESVAFHGVAKSNLH